MIVPMKRLALLCLDSDRERTLETLRDLGCVQLDLAASESPEAAAAKSRLADAGRAVLILEKAFKTVGRKVADVARNSPSVSTRLRDAKIAAIVDEVLAAERERVATAAERDRLRSLAEEYAPFGAFSPDAVAELGKRGIEITLARAPKGANPAAARALLSAGEDGARAAVVPVGPSGGAYAHFAIVRYGAEGAPALPPSWERLRLPSESAAELGERLALAETRLAAQTMALAAAHDRVRDIKDLYPGMVMEIDFADAWHALSSQGPVAWITGWIPENAVPALRAQAVSRSWGIATRDPKPDEAPPTLIRPPKLFRAMTALFGSLGIAPAYSETDVSVPFMCYFSLFFAMLVGDGGYGAIMLAATLYGWHRTKPREGEGHRPRGVRSWLTLMTVFSFATVCWGLLSNTWFGAALPWCRDWRTVEWLGDPSYRNMMFLCFTIGVSHLALARVWNGVCAFGHSACLPEFGWAGILVFMYFVVNWLVGIFAGVPAWTYGLFGVSVLLVASKARGVDLGMLPLNIMGTLGDIISYVRLFAVGFASLMVAKNFNDMAIGLNMPLWLKIVPMVLILLVGHGLNFALAALSVLVHAVRLNTLEFSNHKGITWAGTAFKPFRKI